MNKDTVFNYGLLFFVLWTLVGVYVDGWAHHNVPELETFFTPWHALLYSGFLASFIFLVFHIFLKHKKGKPFLKSLPIGHELSFYGGLLFLLSGLGDMAWHIIFGIEESVDALLSPTHLGLAFGIGLMALGVLRNQWRKRSKKANLAVLLSVTLTLSVITFMIQFNNPIVQPYSAEHRITSPEDLGERIGISGIYIFTLILMSFVFLLLKNWILPFGSLTLILTLNVFFLAIMEMTYFFIPAALISGLTGDAYIKFKKVRFNKSLHTFSFLVPSLFFLFYMITIHLTYGVGWNIHMLTGAVVAPGLIGLIYSYFVRYLSK